MKVAQSIDTLNVDMGQMSVAQAIDALNVETIGLDGLRFSAVSPEDGATGVDTTAGVLFDWSDSEGEGVYRLVASYNSDLSSPVINRVVEGTEYQYGNALTQKVYWKVFEQTVTQQDVIVPQTTGFDSTEGDILALEALAESTSASADLTGWATSGMGLDPAPEGVTVVDGRVTELDIKNKGLTGHINIAEWENLKQCNLIAMQINSLDSQIPQSIMNLANHSLEYLYFSASDNDSEMRTSYPHLAAQTGSGQLGVGKTKGNENNVFRGSLKAPSDPLNNKLKWLWCNWTDSEEGAEDGINEIDPNLFLGTAYEGIGFYENWAVGPNGNAIEFPDLRGCTNLSHIQIGGGSGTSFSGSRNGILTGSIGNKLDGLANLFEVVLDRNRNLILDFDAIDWSASTNFRSLSAPFIQYLGTFPDYLFSSSFSGLKLFEISWPQNSTGVTGNLPEFSASQSLQVFSVTNHNIQNSIPASFWQTNPGIIGTNFSRNDFTSIGTDDLSNLTVIRNLRWSDNSVSGRLPVLAFTTANDDLNSLTTIEIYNNKYNFSDFLWVPTIENPDSKTAFELYADLFTSGPRAGSVNFTYYGQVVGQASSIDINDGQDVVINNFNFDFSHPSNVYKWQSSSDGGNTWSDLTDSASISGSDTVELTITGFTSSNDGAYRLKVTNTLFDSIVDASNLTDKGPIVSETITINIV